MSETLRQEAKGKLGALINEVLQDGVIDEAERRSLQAFFTDALLEVSDVKDVYLTCISALQAEVMADGVVTPEEAVRCRRVVEQLRIPLRMLPPEMVAIVNGAR